MLHDLYELNSWKDQQKFCQKFGFMSVVWLIHNIIYLIRSINFQFNHMICGVP